MMSIHGEEKTSTQATLAAQWARANIRAWGARPARAVAAGRSRKPSNWSPCMHRPLHRHGSGRTTEAGACVDRLGPELLLDP
eukprot:CAMPEP_0197877370 /NCGR_PEP_ID=MMETSP1439-20131203/6081_1 /TAXON_ID=66791 /ORGANISM="Gonyaulax spinifera, Strain CCMP409" /LENGTH=81 /DNA_ID=CAMNT_0043496709 /DNA_START=16 /DNA_END=258 /DNA_ORIENTATION=-